MLLSVRSWSKTFLCFFDHPELLIVLISSCFFGKDYNPFSARHKEHEKQVYYRQLGEDDDIQEISPSSNKSTGNAKSKNIEGRKEKQSGVIENYFMLRATSSAEPTITSLLQNKEAVERCDLAVAKWIIDVCVPFNAVNSKYYQCMIDAIVSMGPGYKASNFHSV